MEHIIPVFSYGSNSIYQLKGRLNNKHLISYPAYIIGYKRIFCGHSNNWNGGVASLVKKKYMKTYGIVVYLDKNELSKLDSYEINYTKHEIICNIMIDNKYIESKCLTYIANNNNWISYPSEQYLIAIQIMLEEHFLNVIDYIIISKINEKNIPQNIKKWKFKKSNDQISLTSFFLIVNTYKNIPWKVPSDINNIVAKLNLININDIDSLKDSFMHINSKLLEINKTKLSKDTLFILKKIFHSGEET